MGIVGQTKFKTDAQTNFLSKQIVQEFNHRSEVNFVKAVLNDLKEQEIVNDLKHLDQSKIEEYVENLQERLDENEITNSTTANYVTALNTIVEYTNFVKNTNLETISAKEFGLSRTWDYADKSISQEVHSNFQNFLEEQQQSDNRFERLSLAVELQKEFGLRAKESFGVRAEKIEKALETGKLHLDKHDYTKNGRMRNIEVRTEQQRELLQKVQNYLQENGLRSLAGSKNTQTEMKQFTNFAYNQVYNFKETTGEKFNFHSERHSWAQSQYSQAWQYKVGVKGVNIQAPIKYYSEQLEKAGWSGEGKFYDAVKEHNITSFYDYVKEETGLDRSEIKEIDKEIRQEISEELGHSRIDITNTYLGHP